MSATFWESVIASLTAAALGGAFVYLWRARKSFRVPRIKPLKSLDHRILEARKALNGRTLSEYRAHVSLGAFGLVLITIGAFFYLQLMARLSGYFGLSWTVIYDIGSYLVVIWGCALSLSLIVRVARVYETHTEYRSRRDARKPLSKAD